MTTAGAMLEKLSGQVTELVTMAGDLELDIRWEQETMATREEEKVKLVDGALQVLELHAGMGFNRKAGKSSAEVLAREEEKWEKVCGACPNAISVRREAGKGSLVAVLSFRDADAIMKALLGVWKLRLEGVHCLTPYLGTESSNMKIGMDDELSGLFIAHVLELREGKLIKELRDEAKALQRKMMSTKDKLKKKFRKLGDHGLLRAVLEDLTFQHDQANRKIGEFQKAMDSIIRTITRLGQEEEECGLDAFSLGPHWTWGQLHVIVERECERLRAQLPMYGRRSDLVAEIFANQVTIANNSSTCRETCAVPLLLQQFFLLLSLSHC